MSDVMAIIIRPVLQTTMPSSRAMLHLLELGSFLLHQYMLYDMSQILTGHILYYTHRFWHIITRNLI